MSRTSPLASPQRHLCELKVAKSCKICIESAFAQPTSTNHICLVGRMYHRIQTLPCTVIKHSRHIKTYQDTVRNRFDPIMVKQLEHPSEARGDSEVEICNGGSWFVKKVNLHNPKMFPTEEDTDWPSKKFREWSTIPLQVMLAMSNASKDLFFPQHVLQQCHDTRAPDISGWIQTNSIDTLHIWLIWLCSLDSIGIYRLSQSRPHFLDLSSPLPRSSFATNESLWVRKASPRKVFLKKIKVS